MQGLEIATSRIARGVAICREPLHQNGSHFGLACRFLTRTGVNAVCSSGANMFNIQRITLQLLLSGIDMNNWMRKL
jgi:hypothetical protein